MSHARPLPKDFSPSWRKANPLSCPQTWCPIGHLTVKKNKVLANGTTDRARCLKIRSFDMFPCPYPIKETEEKMICAFNSFSCHPKALKSLLIALDTHVAASYLPVWKSSKGLWSDGCTMLGSFLVTSLT